MVASNNKSWLIAAWPGMGNVGVIAAHVLINSLGMEPVGALSVDGAFDLDHVTVKNGLVNKPRSPRSVLYRWPNAPEGHGLLLLLSEAQPSNNGLEVARALLEESGKVGIDRVITFAAMACKLDPAADPRVAAAATTTSILDEMKAAEIPVLTAGQIGGMNGLVLGAAAERDIPAVCMLGQIPFFAAGLPNPKTSRALLKVFADLRGIDIDTSELDDRIDKMEAAFTEMLEHLPQQSIAFPGDPFEDDDEDDDDADASETEVAEEPMVEPKHDLDTQTRQSIEDLFRDAKSDRSVAQRLKSELDRLGVFGQYENRFLDLFKQAR